MQYITVFISGDDFHDSSTKVMDICLSFDSNNEKIIFLYLNER